MAHDRYRPLNVLQRRVSYASGAMVLAYLNNGPQLPVHVYVSSKMTHKLDSCQLNFYHLSRYTVQCQFFMLSSTLYIPQKLRFPT